MAIILQDAFVGSAGDMDGRTPDTTFATLNWVTDPGEPINLDGTGAAESADQSVVDARGFADVGLGGTTDYGLPTGVTTTITFVVKTGASVTQGSTAYEGFGLTVEAGETTFGCGLFGPTSGSGLPWQVNEEAFGDDDAVITPAINTEYTGVYEIADGAQTLTFMGNTINSTVAFANPALGVNRISIKVGAGFKLMSILVEDDQAIPVSADLTAPMGQLTSYTGARFVARAPSGLLRSVSHDSTGERAFNGTAPMGLLIARTGARAALAAPMGSMEASITVPVAVNASLAAPMGQVQAEATGGVLVTANLTLAGRARLAAYMGAQVSMIGPIGSLSSSTTVGSLVALVATAPMGQLQASATAGATMRADLVAPMITPAPTARAFLLSPMGSLTAVARAVLAVVYEAYAVNLKPGPKMPNQVTRYTDYPFNQIVRFKGRYLGVADDGLYELGGDTDYDATTPANPAWSWHTGETDFNSPQLKNVREAIFAGRLGPKATASVSVREAADRDYIATIVRGTAAQNHRIKYGRGLKARYWSFGWADPAGGECDTDVIQFDVAELGRKL